jgi:hypothetical protein
MANKMHPFFTHNPRKEQRKETKIPSSGEMVSTFKFSLCAAMVLCGEWLWSERQRRGRKGGSF